MDEAINQTEFMDRFLLTGKLEIMQNMSFDLFKLAGNNQYDPFCRIHKINIKMDMLVINLPGFPKKILQGHTLIFHNFEMIRSVELHGILLSYMSITYSLLLSSFMFFRNFLKNITWHLYDIVKLL